MTFSLKMASLSIFVGMAVGSLVAPQAYAGVLTAATILQDFNAVVYTNGSTSADIEGAAVIGGNFSGATTYINPTQSQPTGYGALTVFGNLNDNININNNGNAYVGGTKNGIISFNGGKYLTNSPGAITDFENPLQALSNSLTKLAANNTFTTSSGDNSDAFNVTTSTNGIAVFDITSAQLDAIHGYNINLNGASTIIINVSDTTATPITVGGNLLGGLGAADNIIWNFEQATNITLNTQFEGTVLANDATVTNNNQIDGTLVASTWNGNGELHDYGFTGTLPATVPEPGALTLLIGGILALMLVRRKSQVQGIAV